jgi:cytochrome c553
VEGPRAAKLGTLFVCMASALLAQAPTAASEKALLDHYCVMCHSQKLKTGGVVLEGIDLTQMGASAEVLEKVARKVKTGEMPPAGMPRPAAAKSAELVAWIEDSIDRYAAANPNPGRPVIHRLNRAEYSNAIRDLLGVDTKPGMMLPVDDSGFGFDNMGAVLSVSPALLERYMTAARKISRLAIGDAGLKPVEEEFSARELGMRTNRNERVSDALPFDSRGGLAFQYYFPVDAEYQVRVRVAGGDATSNATPYELRLPIHAGLRTVGVDFPRDSDKPEIGLIAGRRGGGGGGAATGPGRGMQALPALMDLRLDGAKVKQFSVTEGAGFPQVDKVIIDGPFNATGRGDTASREKIFVCRPPADGKDDEPCARMILTTLAHRAFRRPVTDADIRPLMAFYKSGRQAGDFDSGIEKALRALLVSPDFLFRVERDGAGKASGPVYRVSDLELASRLSFFLWSSIPDDTLLGLAEKGKLKDPAVLTQQVKRMLDDPKSQALVDNFADQWLTLRNLALSKPDPDAFPEFDESLRQGFMEETNLFVQNLIREDRPITELIDANYTFVNERLAEFYGIQNIYGSQFRKVTLTDPNRGGLLGQGAILTVTSYPNRTSVVQRGKWILETLLGAPPPPPPPDIPTLEASAKDGHARTMRQAMEEHRKNAVCASCHSRMDPLGFALENYDGVGKWRTKDSGMTIDPSGKLPDGTTFEGPAGLKKALLASHRDEFLGTVTAKFLTYALGRGLEYYDMPAVRSITHQAAKDDYRFSALVTAIVQSTPFEMRRAPEE